MKKWVKCVGVSVLIASTLAISGCNEEKKYNEIKNELQPLMKDCLTMDYDTKSKDGFEKSMASHDEKRAVIDKKLAEMEELAKSEVKMNNDFQAFKKEFEEKDANIVGHEKYMYKQNMYWQEDHKDYKIAHPW